MTCEAEAIRSYVIAAPAVNPLPGTGLVSEI